MNLVDEYFKEKAKKVNFIELKDYVEIDKFSDIIDNEILLPLVSDVMADGIKKGYLEKEVRAESIIDGMIYIIASDRSFKYMESYINILKKYNRKMDDYIFFKGIKFLEKGSQERAEIYFRALSIIYPEHLLGLFNYALALERLAQSYINQDKLKLGEEFLKESTLYFEKTLDIDDTYPLSYYKLGYHYRYNRQYLKAKLMWEKYLKLDKDDLRLQEVREEISAIEDEVLLESGLTYLSYNRFEEALDSFLKLKVRNEKWWELRYLIGNTYAGLGEYESAIKEYKTALELNDEVEDVYNELGIELFKQSKVEEAIEVFTKGIGKLPDSYKLYFNRGLGYLQLGLLNKALVDVELASKLRPGDSNILDVLEQIKGNL